MQTNGLNPHNRRERGQTSGHGQAHSQQDHPASRDLEPIHAPTGLWLLGWERHIKKARVDIDLPLPLWNCSPLCFCILAETVVRLLGISWAASPCAAPESGRGKIRCQMSLCNFEHRSVHYTHSRSSDVQTKGSFGVAMDVARCLLARLKARLLGTRFLIGRLVITAVVSRMYEMIREVINLITSTSLSSERLRFELSRGRDALSCNQYKVG